jgi:predicted kinase
MNKGSLTILCAPARAGKSTFARTWEQESVKRVVVNADTIRLVFGHRYNGYIEDFVWVVNDIIIKKYLKMGYEVMSDETCTTRQSIQRLFKLDIKAGVFFVFTSPEVCKERAKSTNQEDLYPVIDRMFSNLKGLWKDHFRSEKPFLWEDSDECHDAWNKIFDKIRSQTKIYEPRIAD